MAMKKPGPYAPLSAYYADDERIMAAGEDAEVLYLRMLAYAARTPTTEGWISDAVLQSRLGIVPRQSGTGTGNDTGNGTGTDAGSRARKLEEVGLIVRSGSGWQIVSWLRWNKSAAEMGKERSRDRDRKAPPTRGSTGTGTGNDTGNGTGKVSVSRKQRSETETEAETYSSELAPLASDREDVNEILDLLDSCIRANGAKVPRRTKSNLDAARLLLDRDKRPLDEVRLLIRWATSDEFWKSNILSMAKFRDKYDALRLRSGKGAHREDERDREWKTVPLPPPGMFDGDEGAIS